MCVIFSSLSLGYPQGQVIVTACCSLSDPLLLIPLVYPMIVLVYWHFHCEVSSH